MATLIYPLPVADANVAIHVSFTEQGLTLAEYVNQSEAAPKPAQAKFSPAEQALAQRIGEQLAAYWRNPQHRFSLPLLPMGTPFQQRVWQAMCAIPVGQTRSYGEVAKTLTTAPRAVGGACGANPFPLFVPCHRIVGQGHLGGFSHQRGGVMLVLKQALLTHEGALPAY